MCECVSVCVCGWVREGANVSGVCEIHNALY